MLSVLLSSSWSTDYSRTTHRFCTCSQSSCPRPQSLLSSSYRSTDYSRTTHRFCTCSQSSCPRPPVLVLPVYRLLTDYSQVLHVLSVLLSSSWSTDYSRTTHRFCTCSQSSCPRPPVLVLPVYRLLTDYSQVLHVLSVLPVLSWSTDYSRTHSQVLHMLSVLLSSSYQSTDYSRTTHRFCTCSQSSCPRPPVLVLPVYRLLTDYSQVHHCLESLSSYSSPLLKVLHVLSVLLSSSSCPRPTGLPTTHGLHSQVLHVLLSPSCPRPRPTGLPTTHGLHSQVLHVLLSPSCPRPRPTGLPTTHGLHFCTGSARATQSSCPRPRPTGLPTTHGLHSQVLHVLLSPSCPRPRPTGLPTTHGLLTGSARATQSSCPRPPVLVLPVYRLLTDYSQVLHVLSVLLSSSYQSTDYSRTTHRFCTCSQSFLSSSYRSTDYSRTTQSSTHSPRPPVLGLPTTHGLLTGSSLSGKPPQGAPRSNTFASISAALSNTSSRCSMRLSENVPSSSHKNLFFLLKLTLITGYRRKLMPERFATEVSCLKPCSPGLTIAALHSSIGCLQASHGL